VPYEDLEHTSDLMVEVSARDLSELFAEAALALLDILTDRETVLPRERVSIQLEAENTEQLLVSWLTELLFLYETERKLFSQFEIHDVDERRIHADALGERFEAGRHPIDREVKAVTYHRLEVVREGGVLKTAIVFDL
jgi:SHS2 domain-containing protein